ncbi:MAG TPA: TIGR02996 domain-containing protein [Gemmataceae bacterium]|nr:TIGR02996 domain-containing protein [Gemmataceae bacterium]
MPPPGHEPFLRAICADPADDTVRLAYADWLDENGASPHAPDTSDEDAVADCGPDRSRAEFIRLQIILPTRPHERDARYARIREVFAQYREAWLAELPALEGVQWGIDFRRGFCDRAIIRAADLWVEHRERIVSATPVRFLALSGAGRDGVRAALDVPEVGKLTTLALWDSRIARGHLGVVADSPFLAELRTLILHRRAAPGMWPNESVTDDEAAALADTPHLPKLESLTLDGWVSQSAERRLRARFKSVWSGCRIRPSTPPPGSPIP